MQRNSTVYAKLDALFFAKIRAIKTKSNNRKEINGTYPFHYEKIE